MAEIKFRRFTLNQRIQHILFFVSFILLAYTGFPLKFPEAWWSRLMIESVGGFDNRTLIHHLSGLVMIGVSVYHVVFHILEKPRYDVLFNLKDLDDFKQQIKYYLSILMNIQNSEDIHGNRSSNTSELDSGGCYGFYWITDVAALRSHEIFPYWIYPDSEPFPYLEAVLASIAVFIGHFYDEHFDKFPNLSWLTGNIPEEELRHEHPLEYEEAMKNRVIPENIEPDKKNNILLLGFAKLIFTMIFVAICVWMLWISYNVLAEAIRTYII